MSRLVNLADGGRRLVSLVRDAIDGDEPVDGDGGDQRSGRPLLVAVIPNGVPVAEPIADALGLPVTGARLEREGEPRVFDLDDVRGRTVIVVDDGVETGTAARLVGMAARDAGAERVILAVPVCPREAEALLVGLYDDIVAVERPLVRRDLRWHYEDFDTIDEPEAVRRLGHR